MSGDHSPVFTYFVLILCSLVFFVNLFLPYPVMMQLYSDYAIMPASFFLKRSYLTLFTYQFLHLNFQHLISNMFVLFSVGRAVESEIGSTKFGISYITAGVFSGLLHVMFNQGSDVLVIGASGAIFGAIALLLLMMPFKFTSAMIIPVPGFVLGISMLVIEVASILFNNDVWVAHDIHLYGFLAGGLASFGIDYDRALRGLVISVVIILVLYYWAFYVEGIVL
jgi:membrane associated rhomboid family serine protease